MSKNRVISFTLYIDFDESIKEIKKRNSIFLIECVNMILKVLSPLRTKMLLSFLKSKNVNILRDINNYLQQYHLEQVGNISKEEVADQKIMFILEDTKIDYQKLSEFELIGSEFLKKIIRNMKYLWVEKKVISFLNTDMVKSKVLEKISPKVKKMLYEK